MSVLSFVALELQTTHLDPASVSQASYVKLVNGNVTLMDSWPVIPPTVSNDTAKESPQQTRTWSEALSQLTMMVGPLPVVSYYRDADKEVFQAASQHSGETPPEFRWLDCRELAKKYLPDLPEFQLSTVLKALDLFDEYSDSNSVEQTSQIVIELARRHNASSVRELWRDLYDQPDKILGLDAGLEGLNFAAEPAPVTEKATEEAHDKTATDESPEVDDTVHSDRPIDHEPEWEEPEELEEHVDDALDEPAEAPHHEETQDNEPVEETADSPAQDTEPRLAQPVTASVDDPEDIQRDDTVAGTAQDITPTETLASQPFDERSEPQQPALPEPADDPGPAVTAELAGDPHEDVSTEPLASSTDDNRSVAAVEAPDDGPEVPNNEPLGPPESQEGDIPEQPTPTEDRQEIPAFEVVEVAERPVREPQVPKKSRALRTLGFLGVFGFGLLTVVGLVLAVMATMLFFTDNALMLETKIAGVILTGAITLLSLLMTTISFKAFREN